MFNGGVYVRYNSWCKKGVWVRMFETMADAPDLDYLMADVSIVRISLTNGRR